MPTTFQILDLSYAGELVADMEVPLLFCWNRFTTPLLLDGLTIRDSGITLTINDSLTIRGSEKKFVVSI